MNSPTPRTTSAPAPRVRHRTPFDSPFTVTKIGRRFDGPQVARVLWSEHWHGSQLLVIDRLDERQYMICCQWAVGVLLRQVTPEGYLTSGAENLSRAELLILETPSVAAAVVDLDAIDEPARGVVCLDCGHLFSPDYSPELDRCAGCAEDHDAENGADQ